MNIILTKLFPQIKNVLFHKELFKNAIIKNTPSSKSKCFSSGNFPMDKLSSLPNDVLLYTFEKSKIIRYFTIFGVAQFGVCAFLGGNIFVSLKDTANRTISDDKVSDAHSWRRINFGDVKYRIIAGLSCLSIGVLIAYISYALPQRIVKELTLHRGGKLVSITTYAPLGRTNHFQVPLQQMNCTMSRTQAKSYVPIKIKNKWFYYLMDCKGQFHQPQLFDLSVGAKSWGS